MFQLPQAQQETAGWWAPPLIIPGLLLKNYMPSPTSSNFWIMRQQKAMALARPLKAHAEESWFLIGSSVMQQWMAPPIVLNGDEIVEATLLTPVEGECRTSPMPEEKATLLGDITPKIKHEIELSQVADNWKSMCRYCLQSELPILWPLSCPILLHSVTSLPERQRSPKEGQPG